ncbi:hypothetical protein [Corynebacterium yudongzhengii]|uniref:hypothetical protein n=1 Tax=Corynebacterium yudongzhengii TaxID=2080740 RepID=UPI001F25D4A9|nr:hypothetical protein [Corynebacterium yudongzhengii]
MTGITSPAVVKAAGTDVPTKEDVHGEVDKPEAFLKSAGALGVLSALSGCARTTVPADSALPQQSVWVTYPAGTGTYNDIAAIANTVTAESGVRVRLMTGDTGIARMGPLISGTAQYSRAGDEYFYAFEGDDEYASQVWAPSPCGRFGRRRATMAWRCGRIPASTPSKTSRAGAGRGSSRRRR